MYEFFIEPFGTYPFLRRALIACIALSMGCAPVGVLLVLRRMSLMGDALSHSVLPGVALGYLFMGLSLPAMGIGGMFSGLIVALLASFISRKTVLKEDASFVGFYLIALALGAILVSTKGKNIDLMHILFGSILAVDKASLLLIAGITTISLFVMALIFRPLVLECFDPIFMRSIGGRGSLYHLIFMGLVVLNMVSAFQALGTLMALGMMMLPAITARFWAREIWSLYLVAILVAIVSGFLGLVFSYHYGWPSGPAIILTSGVLYLVTVVFGPYGSLRCRRT
ncbi:MAG: metal ABC transporter permease [Candidatus Paracaedimonas acanthamoebae]|uniref:Metal ABC transporter permease n=1 Tax=Candidatus Paracaedimonas acanthamoebae TaxID=244581 RepID=A0A8J7TVM3_9PROT|nr:metal ABC transporter permease [Candidatus Paracaedimonas acanthamoebae]